MEHFKEVWSIFKRLNSAITGSFDVEYRLFFSNPYGKDTIVRTEAVGLAIRGSQYKVAVSSVLVLTILLHVTELTLSESSLIQGRNS